jgi:hypothetical protein
MLYVISVLVAATYFAVNDPSAPKPFVWVGAVLWPVIVTFAAGIYFLRIPFYIAERVTRKKGSHIYWVGGPSIEERISIENEIDRDLRRDLRN